MLVVYAPILLHIIRTTELTTARLLSICILCFSLVPLASIYLFFSFFTAPESDESLVPWAHDKGLSVNTTSLQQVWDMLVQHQHSAGSTNNPPDFYALLSTANMAADAYNPMPSLLAILIPYTMSLLLGIIFPLSSLIYSLCMRRGGWLYKVAKKKRKETVDQALRSYSKTLHGCVAPTSEEQEQRRIPVWTIPFSGVPVADENDEVKMERRIPDQCVICLAAYQDGDVVSWSSNPNCVHAFHQTCIASWLYKRRNARTWPCPCCRQSFLCTPATERQPACKA